MSFRFKPGQKIYIYQEEIDFRFGFEKLTFLVREKLQMKIVDGDMFVFLGRNRQLAKCLCYDGTGLVLIKKRIESGKFMPLNLIKESEITVEELDTLFSGGKLYRKKFGEIPA